MNTLIVGIILIILGILFVIKGVYHIKIDKHKKL